LPESIARENIHKKSLHYIFMRASSVAKSCDF